MRHEPATDRHWWSGPGGGGEVLHVAWPLILSNSFWTLQITLDRVLLSQASSEMVAAAMAAAMLFWTPMTLLQFTAAYATTFVAQYTGAGQPRRAGPAVWQALYFSAVTGLAFLALSPLAGPLLEWTGHSPALQQLEADYFHCLCFSALPALIAASASSFFTGLGKSRVVLLINGVGFVVNGLLDYVLIFGHWGFPNLGIAGAGWATVCGCWASAVLGMALMLRAEFRATHATASGWRFEGPLFRRLMHYGLPNGLVTSLETFAFTIFIALVLRLGEVEGAATSIAFTLNLFVFLPILGFGQAVGVLVGQRLGENRPELAEQSVRSGLWLALVLTGAAALLYVLIPDLLVAPFRPQTSDPNWPAIAALVPLLLRFVALYALFDSANIVFSFALRGAGDTRFVSRATVLVSWFVMMVPTWLACEHGLGLFWAWSFASGYVLVLSGSLFARFLQGKWKSMRVIETKDDLVPAGVTPTAEVERAAC